MKLVTFLSANNPESRPGLLTDAGVIDLSRVAPSLPSSMLGIIEAGPEALVLISSVAQSTPDFSIDEVTIQAPIQRPPKVIAIGLNYRAHAIESNMDLPKVPLVFTKQSTSVTGPSDPIFWSEEGKALDYEGELAIVIGKRCRRVPKDKAKDVILGYTVLNDVSVRDWQLRGSPPSFTMGKSWDSHCPIGPAIVVDPEINPHELLLTTHVNGDLRQQTSTDDLIFNCYELIEFLSTAFTLEPGDIIATGTPSGVGFAMKPPVPLVIGDKVKVSIEGLGFIENEVIQEPADRARFF
jgi:2-keto-4-pentenoate hydratase/2-oxohepta-3-ene-1,7-dioic acid hydratase in catechol pathway